MNISQSKREKLFTDLQMLYTTINKILDLLNVSYKKVKIMSRQRVCHGN